MTDTQFAQPTTREELLLALLDMLGLPALRGHAHATLDQLYALPVADDPVLRELRLLRTALGIIDYGARLMASTPLAPSIGPLVADVLAEIEALNLHDTTRMTQQAQYAVNVLEAAITGDWSRLPAADRQSPELTAVVAQFRAQLAERPLTDDVVGAPVWDSDIRFCPDADVR